MISPEEAQEIAIEYFPNAPEQLVNRLGIKVRESPMKGCDGYCLSIGERSIIRINSLLSGSRKRFTLAHELGHLILGIPGVIGETFEEMLSSNLKEERRVNNLASALLLPEYIVKDTLKDLPIVAGALQKLAKKANVSDLSAAIRVCNLASTIGLIRAYVVFFDNEHVKWQWSQTSQMPESLANYLLAAARSESPRAFRHKKEDGNVIVASIIENPYFGSSTLFVQLLPEEHGLSLSLHEKRKLLEQEIFSNNDKLRNQVSGLMGAHKPRVAGMTLNEAIINFWDRNEAKLAETEMLSQSGREYVELRIKEFL
ncbi:MAG: hypothetical protein COA78_14695 [Blastopirellula sp.]|nr:MAG: hypothetical protein COA78_14695 [Blastopirellula sp.]